MFKENPIKKENILKIFTDAASRNNPGPAACSFIFLKNGDETTFKEYCEFLGKVTNNVAEYEAIIKALNCATEFTRWKVEVYSDSELVINHINGIYRVKKDHLREKLQKVFELKRFFEKVNFFYIPRTNKFIQICDKLCNKKLDDMGMK